MSESKEDRGKVSKVPILPKAEVITSRVAFREIAAVIRESGSVALDIETYGPRKGDGLNPWQGDIRLLSLCRQGRAPWIIDLRATGYDLGELGRHIRDYAELMDHIDAVLPGRVHRLYYERLVGDPEAELDALLRYCGLPFESGCLRFYENRRIVQSVSSEQVRRPIYGEGVDQWRNYEPWLGPLKASLGDLVDRYPALDVDRADRR